MILFWLGIEPDTEADRDNLVRGLESLLASDLSLAVKPGEAGVVMLGAASDAQLDAAIDRLVNEFDVKAAVTGIEIAYKEALTVSARGEAKFVDQFGGRGHYAHVRILVQPRQQGSGYVFENLMAGASIPGEFVTPIEEGIREARDRGVLAGYAIEDVHVTLYDGSYHDVDSSPGAFRVAAAQAFLDAAKKAQPVLLEPIMHVALIVPEEYVSRAKVILLTRRGEYLGCQDGVEWPAISARVPLAETFGLPGEVRERTAGRGMCHVRFSHYAPAAHADDDGDRAAPVTWPKNPRTPPHVLRASVPEPTGDFDDRDPPA